MNSSSTKNNLPTIVTPKWHKSDEPFIKQKDIVDAMTNPVSPIPLGQMGKKQDDVIWKKMCDKCGQLNGLYEKCSCDEQNDEGRKKLNDRQFRLE